MSFFEDILRESKPEYAGLSDAEIAKRARRKYERGLGVSPDRLKFITGEEEPDTLRQVRRAIQGFGTQVAGGFGDELAELFAAPVNAAIGAADLVVTGLTRGDVSEAVDRINAVFEGGFDDVGDFARQELARGYEENPLMQGAADIGGAVTGGLLPAVRPAGALQGGARALGAGAGAGARPALTMRFPRTVQGQMGAGAAEGAVWGAGNAQPGERLSGALEGAALGAGLGALPAAGGAAWRGIQSARRPVMRAAGGAAGDFFTGFVDAMFYGRSPYTAAKAGAARVFSGPFRRARDRFRRRYGRRPPPYDAGEVGGNPNDWTEAPPRPRDADAPPRDAGAPPRDAGAPPRDAGAPPRDAGAPPRDAGAPPRDAGAPPRGSGSVIDVDFEVVDTAADIFEGAQAQGALITFEDALRAAGQRFGMGLDEVKQSVDNVVRMIEQQTEGMALPPPAPPQPMPGPNRPALSTGLPGLPAPVPGRPMPGPNRPALPMLGPGGNPILSLGPGGSGMNPVPRPSPPGPAGPLPPLPKIPPGQTETPPRPLPQGPPIPGPLPPLPRIKPEAGPRDTLLEAIRTAGGGRSLASVQDIRAASGLPDDAFDRELARLIESGAVTGYPLDMPERSVRPSEVVRINGQPYNAVVVPEDAGPLPPLPRMPEGPASMGPSPGAPQGLVNESGLPADTGPVDMGNRGYFLGMGDRPDVPIGGGDIMDKRPLYRVTLADTGIRKPGESIFADVEWVKTQQALVNDMFAPVRQQFDPGNVDSNGVNRAFQGEPFKQAAADARQQLRTVLEAYGLDTAYPGQNRMGQIRVQPLDNGVNAFHTWDGEVGVDPEVMNWLVSPSEAERALHAATMIHEELHGYGNVTKELFGMFTSIQNLEEMVTEVAARRVARDATGYPFPITVDRAGLAYQHVIDDVIDALGAAFLPKDQFRIAGYSGAGDKVVLTRMTTRPVLGSLEEWLENASLRFKQITDTPTHPHDLIERFTRSLWETRPFDWDWQDYDLFGVADPKNQTDRVARALEKALAESTSVRQSRTVGSPE